MDHYIPKRRVPVTLWSNGVEAASVQLFLDLDAVTHNHQTILEKLNESTPFLPAAVGDPGRIHLFNKSRITRVTPGASVIQSDVFSRGFRPWREEPASMTLVDGTPLAGRMWMPLERETQRLSDYLNQGCGYIVLLTTMGPQLVNPAAISELSLTEAVDGPLALPELDDAPQPSAPDLRLSA